MSDAEIDSAPAEALRVAYRALRDQHGQLVAAALAGLKEQGKYTGGWKPYGYELGADGETLVKVDAEQLVIERVRAMRALGMGLRVIARTLNEQGVLSREKTKFSPTQIKRMLAPSSEAK